MQRQFGLLLFSVLVGIFPAHVAYATSDAASPVAVVPPPAPGPAAQAEDQKVHETLTGTDIAGPEKKPAELIRILWQEKDLPPLCLDQMLMGETVQPKVAIPSCNDDPEKKVLRTYTDDGWVKTDYRYKTDSADEPALTSMYRVLGKVTDGYALEIYSATGGSGRFTSVVVVKADGPTLELIHNYGAGDRCNGGVADAEVKNGSAYYGFYLTPGDFASVAFGDDQGLVAYEDLEASAASCFAVQRYKDGKMEFIELQPDAFKEDQEGWTSNYALQTCMNGYLRKIVSAGKTKFTLPEFKDLMNGFLKSCQKA